jgi:hypothetical protein
MIKRMENFVKKIKYVDSLFINKFGFYDSDNKKLKIYYISPDNNHSFLSVDFTPNAENEYSCEFGTLYIGTKQNITYEDTAIECFSINRNEFKSFKKYHDFLPKWDKSKITEINNFNTDTNLTFVF